MQIYAYYVQCFSVCYSTAVMKSDLCKFYADLCIYFAFSVFASVTELEVNVMQIYAYYAFVIKYVVYLQVVCLLYIICDDTDMSSQFSVVVELCKFSL